MPGFKAKVVVVTGGSRGIGAAIVSAFVAEGAKVVTCGRGARPSGLDLAILWVTADVALSADVGRLRDATLEAHGRVDVLVNNAGVLAGGAVAATDDATYDALMGVNAKGLFLCCRAFIAEMKRTGGGAIINIGSVSGMVSDPDMAIYNASKAFVHSLTRSIAVDHGPDGIRCNAICPGWIATGMLDDSFVTATDKKAAKHDVLARHAAGRFGRPEDVAAAAVYLASDAAAFVTGQTLVVDGGLTAASPARPGLF
jgi:NAD(P)-dependent dehydrogenase (short-subunit alcohol dehydrogenase family)